MKSKPHELVAIAFKIVVFSLAVWIAGLSLWGAFHPEQQSRIFRSLMTSVPWAGYAHVFGGSLALILGGVQLSSVVRQKNLDLHKRLGTLYVVCVIISTIGAMATLLESTTAWSAKSGFWLLAVVWPAITMAGYPWGGVFDVQRHGRLMIYSYALTCAAITLRIYLGIMMASGVSFSVAYPIAAWGGGVGNVLLAFIVLRIAGRDTKPARVA